MAESRFGKEVVVGTIVLVAAAVFIGGTMWLSGKSVGGGGYVVDFANAGELKLASPVRISGVPAGKVRGIALQPDGRVHVTIRLDDEMLELITLRRDARAFIRPVGLAGDVSLVLEPGTDAAPLAPGALIPGEAAAGFTDLADKLAGGADSLLRDMRALVGPERAARLDTTLRKLDATLASTQALMALYANPKAGPTAELQATLVEYRALAARLDSTLQSPALVRARDKADTLVDNLADMSAQFRATGARLDSVLARVERGEGTLGKLATDTALYGRFTDLSGSVDSLVRDLRKNPGKIGVTVKMF
jgi:phospholipid/cholesterol/gamma-HCH transport system substrate-binding protein